MISRCTPNESCEEPTFAQAENAAGIGGIVADMRQGRWIDDAVWIDLHLDFK